MEQLRILRAILVNLIERIDSGNCNLTAEEIESMESTMHRYIDEMLSKYECCRMLRISRASFDRLVRTGVLPRGKAKPGAHELFWNKRDIQRYLDAQEKKK